MIPPNEVLPIGVGYSRGRSAEATELGDATFVEVWQDADAQVQPLVGNARQRLATLMSDG